MKKLYDKSELYFALLWIGIYVVAMSVMDNLSVSLGMEHAVTAAGGLGISIFLLLWLKKEKLLEKFGLCKGKMPARAFLWYIPLIILTTRNLWSGARMNHGMTETLLFVVKMLGVGFLEELIFRGFLFKAMSKDSVKWAVAVSSVTFGLGHILNLVNGSGMGLTENLFQIVSAVVIGFLYVIIFHRGGSLWPCILSHGCFNSLSAFANEDAPAQEVTIYRVVLCALALIYALVLLKTLPKPAEGK